MTEKPRVNCPRCGRRYRWKPDLAGRAVACGCGQKMMLPQRPDAQPTPLNDPDRPSGESMAGEYELDVPETHVERAQTPPGDRPGKCPRCNSPLKPGAVICLNCGFDVDRGRVIQTRVATDADDGPGDAAPDPPPAPGEPTPAESRWLARGPGEVSGTRIAWIVIAVSLPAVIGIFYGLSPTWADFLVAIRDFAIQTVMGLPILLLGVLVCAVTMKIPFGSWLGACLKLVAVSLAVSVVGGSFFLMLGGAAVLLFLLILFAMYLTASLLIGAMFDLDAVEARVVTLVIIGVQVLVELGLAGLRMWL